MLGQFALHVSTESYLVIFVVRKLTVSFVCNMTVGHLVLPELTRGSVLSATFHSIFSVIICV